MEQTLSALVQLAADIPQPQVDMDDLRLDPDAFEIEEDEQCMLLAPPAGDGGAWILRNCAGEQREVDELFAQLSLRHHASEPVMRVFLSSTFRDMAIERDHLMRTVFPRLKRMAQAHGVTMQEIDLRWSITAGLAALDKAGQGGYSMRALNLVVGALPFAASLGEPQLILAAAQHCVKASYELAGEAALGLRLEAVAEAAQAYLMLGEFEELVSVVAAAVDIGQRGGPHAGVQGRCARLMAGALLALERWQQALDAVEFAWEAEAGGRQDVPCALNLSAMMAICLIRLEQVEGSRRWLEVFVGCANGAGTVPPDLLAFIGEQLLQAGRADEQRRLGQALAIFPSE